MVNLRAVIDVEGMHHAGVFLDPVDDPVGTAPGGVAAGEGPEHRRANAVGVDREGGIAELQYRGCRTGSLTVNTELASGTTTRPDRAA